MPMKNVGTISSYGLENHGITRSDTVYWNLPVPMLIEQAIRRGEGVMSANGPFITHTGEHTGRSPNDKFIVKEPSSQDDIWWGDVNIAIKQEQFDSLLSRVLAYVQNRDLFVFDGYAGADERYQLKVRVINEYAWHNMFANNMFRRESNADVLKNFTPDFTVIDVPRFLGDGAIDGLTSSTFVLVDFAKKLVLIGGTEYGGEIKKSIFGSLNYYLPKQGVLPMHCSANYGEDRDDCALFFGLSGTGKTTLSNDTSRTLIGDDEHGWSDDGVFNFEGGCYAKVIRLDPEGEPEIYATTRSFGTILENVVYDPITREVDLDDGSLTQNTRSSYPITQIPNADLDGIGGHPKNVLFLTADAFGVLPPISKLTKSQAMYHFLSGYTAKVAGTERGVTEPSPVFSACFGAPFMPLHPGEYAKLLGEKVEKHEANVWLVNTGWTGGPYGIGNRMKLAYTRRMVSAAITGELDNCETVEEPYFGFAIPKAIEGVPTQVLSPRETWEDKAAYDAQASKLVAMFIENFKQFESGVTDEIKNAGPKGA